MIYSEILLIATKPGTGPMICPHLRISFNMSHKSLASLRHLVAIKRSLMRASVFRITSLAAWDRFWRDLQIWDWQTEHRFWTLHLFAIWFSLSGAPVRPSPQASPTVARPVHFKQPKDAKGQYLHGNIQSLSSRTFWFWWPATLYSEALRILCCFSTSRR